MTIACLMRGECGNNHITYSQRVVDPRFQDDSKYREFLLMTLLFDIEALGADTTTGVWRMEMRESLT